MVFIFIQLMLTLKLQDMIRYTNLMLKMLIKIIQNNRISTWKDSADLTVNEKDGLFIDDLESDFGI